MRTTLSIDDDVLAAVKHLAERENKNVGEVVSFLARQGLARQLAAFATQRDSSVAWQEEQGADGHPGTCQPAPG